MYPAGAIEFARSWNIPASTRGYRQLFERMDTDMVAVGVLNHLHGEIVVAKPTSTL